MKHEPRIDRLEALLMTLLFLICALGIFAIAFAYLPVYYYQSFGWKGPLAYFLIPTSVWLAWSILRKKAKGSHKRVD